MFLATLQYYWNRICASSALLAMNHDYVDKIDKIVTKRLVYFIPVSGADQCILHNTLNQFTHFSFWSQPSKQVPIVSPFSCSVMSFLMQCTQVYVRLRSCSIIVSCIFTCSFESSFNSGVVGTARGGLMLRPGTVQNRLCKLQWFGSICLHLVHRMVQSVIISRFYLHSCLSITRVIP